MAREPKLRMVRLHRFVHQIGQLRKIYITLDLLGAPWRRIEIDKQACGNDEPEERHEYECPFQGTLHSSISLPFHSAYETLKCP